VRQLLALRELRESITPSDKPVSLTFLRSGDAVFLEEIDRRITLIQTEIMAKRNPSQPAPPTAREAGGE
jgi:hypothetical protein